MSLKLSGSTQARGKDLSIADFGIPARRLVVLWVAAGLVYHGEEEEPPELMAERYLTELIDMNMVQVAQRKSNGRVKSCRLPNPLRQFLLNAAPSTISNSRMLQVADRLDRDDIWHNHIHGNNTIDSASLKDNYEDVFSFLSFDAREGSKPGQDIYNFLNLCILTDCLLLLLVLDLEGVFKPKLPENIARLTRLRRGSSSEGWSRQIGQYQKIGDSMSMSPKQEAMESQLDAVADWIMKLDCLQSLRLKSRDEEGQPWNIHLKSLENHTNLTDLYLLGSLSNPSILSQFPPSLAELVLSHSKLQDDPLEILKDLPNLRSLSLLAESYVGKKMICYSQSFPQLYILKVWKLEQLEEWDIEPEALPCLRQLELRCCQCMIKLPDGLKHVNSLLDLKLTNMPMEPMLRRIRLHPIVKST
ncbi:hypothetical protein VNO78_19948 [Psophocarpus tetragonolobus]|uniref:Disease resistance protein winged helix domain-containing protein n=1 Tax=Psophocarpus tetragonolobus TaxID=3891 RepID=A0AAN9S907_PSOTE